MEVIVFVFLCTLICLVILLWLIGKLSIRVMHLEDQVSELMALSREERRPNVLTGEPTLPRPADEFVPKKQYTPGGLLDKWSQVGMPPTGNGRTPDWEAALQELAGKKEHDA